MHGIKFTEHKHWSKIVVHIFFISLEMSNGALAFRTFVSVAAPVGMGAVGAIFGAGIGAYTIIQGNFKEGIVGIICFSSIGAIAGAASGVAVVDWWYEVSARDKYIIDNCNKDGHRVPENIDR